MGSRGTGRLTDYPGSRGKGSGGGGGQGGSSGRDRCKDAVVEQLEDVARCEYFKNHGNVPRASTKVDIVQQKRIAVATAGGEIVGYLPTKYNYLVACLASGFKYSGTIQRSSNTPIPTVLVDLAAT